MQTRTDFFASGEHTKITGTHTHNRRSVVVLVEARGFLLYVGAVPVDGVPVGGHLEQVRPGETR